MIRPVSPPLLGYSRAEALGQPLGLIVPERFRAEHDRGLAMLQNGATPRLGSNTVEVTALHKHGREVPIELSLSVWRGEAGLGFGAQIADITERKQRELLLEHRASHDPLTGLPNRAELHDRIGAALERREPVALLAIELDGFKGINDAFGHETGDTLLQALSLRLRGVLPADATLARVGGDAFALLLRKGERPDRARSAAATVLDACEKPCVVNGHEVHLSASVGIALAPLHAGDVEELLLRADLALFAARGGGGRRSCLFDKGMAKQLAADRAFRDELRAAAIEGQWELFYQPQVSLATGRAIGAEALLRWRHPRRGLLAPVVFMPTLETHATAYEVGSWVLREACRQLAEWRAGGIWLERVSVNLFPAQLRTGTLQAVAMGALGAHGLSPDSLELEVTERIALRPDDEALVPLTALRNAGVGIAFDDFGTGFASLSTLKHFPLSRLKVDASFVQDMLTDPSSAAIVAGVAAIGHSLGLSVIAEGVETHDHQHMVRLSHCDDGQGFLYGEPMPADDFGAWMRDRLVGARAGASAGVGPR